MDQKPFNKAIKEQQSRCNDVLIKKGTEYATEDMLHNFKIAAALQGETPRQALGGMMAKHTVSIYDMIQSKGDYVMEIWDEKITDHINYLLILKAIIADEKTSLKE